MSVLRLLLHLVERVVLRRSTAAKSKRTSRRITMCPRFVSDAVAADDWRPTPGRRLQCTDSILDSLM